MVKKLFTPSQIKKITGASRHEAVNIPFYYTPPFLDKLIEKLESRLSSSGGRPTIKGADVIRKVRFSKEHWDELIKIATNCSQSGASVSPAQIVSTIIEDIFLAGKPDESSEKVKKQAKKRRTLDRTKRGKARNNQETVLRS